jgi:tetratricopeptide (TPR) repeat protein
MTRRQRRATRTGSSPTVENQQLGAWAFGLIAAALIGAVSLVYANSLSAPFQFDDSSPIENEAVRQSTNADASGMPQLGVQVAGRPIVRASFAINYALGGMDVTGYHLVNIAVHAACTLLLFSIVRRSLSQWSSGELKRGATATAGVAALIWALHPLNTGTVTYISARSESLMALCYLGTLLAVIRAHEASRRSVWSAAAVIACASGMACKETMVTAPLAMAMFDRAIVFPSFKDAFQARWKLYLALAATWLVLLALAWSAPRAESVGLSLGVSPWTYLLNQAEIITDYLGEALVPRRLVFAYGEPRAIGVAEVLPQLLLIAFLAGASLWAWYVRPRIGFLAVTFFVILAPTSSVVPIATEVGAERRMYLPLAALVVLVVAAGRLAWSRLQRRTGVAWSAVEKWLGVATVTVLCTSLAMTTIRRNREYASPEILWRTSLERWPSSVAHRNLATSLRHAGKRDEALEHLRATVVDHPEVRYIIGLELFEMGRYEESRKELTAFLDATAVSGSDVEANARLVLGRVLTSLGRSTDAFEELTRAAADRPDDPAVQLALADVQLARQDFEAALAVYRRYVAAVPRDAGAWTNLGIAALATGRSDEGIDALRRAVALQPQAARSHVNLASALADAGRMGEATSHAAEAARLAPANAKARELYGQLLATQNRPDEAARELEAAVRANPGDLALRETLARLRGSGHAK